MLSGLSTWRKSNCTQMFRTAFTARSSQCSTAYFSELIFLRKWGRVLVLTLNVVLQKPLCRMRGCVSSTSVVPALYRSIQWGEKTFLLCYFDHKSAGLTESSCCHPVSENLSRDGMNMNKGTHVCVHIYTQVHTHTHICTDIHKHTDTPTNTSHTHVHIHMCTHMRTHKHTHHTRIYTHTCMYTYTHACMYTQPSLCIYVFLYYTVPQISTFTALVIFHGFRMSFSIDAP